MVTEKPRNRSGGIRLFKIRGIQIKLDYSWFIIFGLVFWSLSAGYFPQIHPGENRQVYWTAGFFATFLFFFSLFAHELCHSLVAIRLGIEIPEISFFIFGGVSRLSEEAADPQDEFKIAVVGPLCSFALAAIFWAIQWALDKGDQPAMIVDVFGYLAWANVALGVFNLVPGLPLDGGRMLRAFWWWKTGSIAKATKLASSIGNGFAIAMMVLGGLEIFAGVLIGGLWLVFIGMFLRGVAEASYHELAVRQSLEATHVKDIMFKDVVTAPSELPIKRLISDYFLHYAYRGFPVTTDGTVLGMVSLKDVKGLSEEEQWKKTVKEAMVPLKPSYTVPPETSLAEALKKMRQENIGQLLVMRGNQMVGMITETGLLRFLEIKRATEPANGH